MAMKTVLDSLWIGLAASVLVSAAAAERVTSPDGKLQLAFATDAQGRLNYAFRADGRDLIAPSRLGFDGGKYAGCQTRSVNATWKPVWGKRAIVPDRFNEVTLNMTTYRVIARAYDDGVAFRYAGGTGTEETQINFAGDYLAWSYNGENPPIGPEKLSAVDGTRFPVMTVQVGTRCCMAVHEADLVRGEPLVLASKKGETLFRVASKPTEAWRVIMFGRTPGTMVDSHLIELLNPPPPTGMDFSWVKPGVAVWDWRINGAQVDGFKYSMSLPSWKRMVDFAAENKMRHLVLDANWYGPEFQASSNPTSGGKVADVRQIISYGKAKGVGVWLYLNDVGGRQFPIEQTLKQYGEWGAAGVKYGFMEGNPEEKNERTRRITELCARNRLLCNFHDGPVHPYGQMRTWPNAVTREFCHAQLDGHHVFGPREFVTKVYVNMLAGPLDMNNGLADLIQAGRVDEASRVPSTLAGEAARTLIVFSGATIIPDIPENYRKHPELLAFIAAQQQPWRESRTLSGAIGEHIVMARQAADGKWLVGAATDEDPRELDIPLAFLGAGSYKAIVMEDGDDAGFRTYKESYKASHRTVSRSDTIHVKLAPGGGACVLLADERQAQGSAVPAQPSPYAVTVDTTNEPIAPGMFAPTWESLKQYKVPNWFRDAKFGIWAHWGPQCQPEQGDWYARYMYVEGNWKNRAHLDQYGHPSVFGFKDVINAWKAEKWNPDRLVALYKRTGAQYFFAMANHHDNLDMWDSKYQPWNTVRVGPRKDIIGGWARAARAQGLPFGVSFHAAHAWTWYETSQGADKSGPKAGVPYDGVLTKADGKGKWWDGLDPQDLYAQNHPHSDNWEDPNRIHSQWGWENGANIPSQAYVDKFYNRTVDLINRYKPDLVYFDDTVLPLYPFSDAGLKIAAHFYNSNMRWHKGNLRAVLFGKILDEQQRAALVWDIERGVPATILPFPWQTDTCLGCWHYERGFYDRNEYKNATTVIHMLADIVSKNGNLLLSVPMRGDGSIDDKEERVLEGIATWMKVNKESIVGTRPWKVFGEGPAGEGVALTAQGFNEGKGKPFTAQDLRFTAKGNTLYAIVLGVPAGTVRIASMKGERVADVAQLGSTRRIKWSMAEDALVIEPAPGVPTSDPAVVFKITTK